MEPLLQIPTTGRERTQGCAADPDNWKGEVFAYVGSIQNLKDLKARCSGKLEALLWTNFRSVSQKWTNFRSVSQKWTNFRSASRRSWVLARRGVGFTRAATHQSSQQLLPPGIFAWRRRRRRHLRRIPGISRHPDHALASQWAGSQAHFRNWS